MTPPHRRHITARLVPLNSDAAGDARVAGSAEERLALVAELSHRAWQLTGQPVHVYPRGSIPVKLTRLTDQE